jgi:hypothetical protein
MSLLQDRRRLASRRTKQSQSFITKRIWSHHEECEASKPTGDIIKMKISDLLPP